METFVILAYCVVDDALKKIKFYDDLQTKVSSAQIMTTIIVAARFFKGNHADAQRFLHEHKYFHYRLSASRFNRRFHAIPRAAYAEIMRLFGEYAKTTNETFEFAEDSFPVGACDNIRIKRNKLFDPQTHLGYIASKKRYFLGLRVHMIVAMNRLPVEFSILPASVGDNKASKDFEFNLPQGSIVYADKAYNDYKHEADLLKKKNIVLLPIRKENSTKQRTPEEEQLIRRRRKSVETTFSLITQLIPKTIHAVTQPGFLKKLICFVLAHSIRYFPVAT